MLLVVHGNTAVQGPMQGHNNAVCVRRLWVIPENNETRCQHECFFAWFSLRLEIVWCTGVSLQFLSGCTLRIFFLDWMLPMSYVLKWSFPWKSVMVDWALKINYLSIYLSIYLSWKSVSQFRIYISRISILPSTHPPIHRTVSWVSWSWRCISHISAVSSF